MIVVEGTEPCVLELHPARLGQTFHGYVPQDAVHVALTRYGRAPVCKFGRQPVPDPDKWEEWKRKTIAHNAKIIRLEEELTKAWKS